MLISVDLMTNGPPGRILAERLERLTGEEASCCVPQYRTLGRAIHRSAGFPAALRRAKALADEHRLLAVALLKRRGELCACEIQAATGLSHPTVSHHMAVLSKAGWVSARRKGKWLYYRLSGGPEVRIP
jgi:DNA-binding transcriptional ArsR family regulator